MHPLLPSYIWHSWAQSQILKIIMPDGTSQRSQVLSIRTVRLPLLRPGTKNNYAMIYHASVRPRVLKVLLTEGQFKEPAYDWGPHRKSAHIKHVSAVNVTFKGCTSFWALWETMRLFTLTWTPLARCLARSKCYFFVLFYVGFLSSIGCIHVWKMKFKNTKKQTYMNAKTTEVAKST